MNLKPGYCGWCYMPHKRTQMSHCWEGEMHYADGSSRVCPNYQKHMSHVENGTDAADLVAAKV